MTKDISLKIKDKISELLLFPQKKIIPQDFENIALEVFRYQYHHNPIYQKWINYINCNITKIQHSNDIPFLPIRFFKSHSIKSGVWPSQITFKSSGTTQHIRSLHHVKSLDWYNKVSLSTFESLYGAITDYIIIALLPSYLENKDASLVYMVNHFINQTQNSQSGFYLHDISRLHDHLSQLSGKKIILWGVTHALLDVKLNPITSQNLTIIETGGMKGRQKELTKEELHEILCQNMGLTSIGSEYGMTELLSQAYSKTRGLFTSAPSMKVVIRDVLNPFEIHGHGKGVLNIIDLANVDTCSFIATDDLGHLHPNGDFEILGRLDNSDIRGCNQLMV